MSRVFRVVGVFAALLLALRPVGAQQGATINGRVVSDAGAPVPFASVFLEGMGLGTTTREDGNYSFTVPGARVQGQRATLTVRAIGFKNESKQITLNNGTVTENFTLTTNPLRLGEVVVTGAGTQSSIERLGAVVSSVKSEEIVRASEVNAVQALAAKAPGVVVTSSGGDAGAASFIQIRGQKSIEGSSQPLFVVDGVPVDNSSIVTTFNTAGTAAQNRMADLNPADIESVEILKGAAAAAIYGTHAGAGVVLITTKRGRAGAPRWTYRSTYSSDKVTKDYPLQRTYGQGNQGEAAVCGGVGCGTLTGASFGPKLAAGAPVYNHFLEMFENGSTFDNNLSLSGGTDRATFYGSLGRTDQDGIIIGPNDKFSRTTSLVKGTLQLSDKLNVGATVNYASTGGSFIQKGSNLSGLLLGALRTPPEFNNAYYLDSTTGLQRSYRYPRPTATSQFRTRGYDNPFFIVNKLKNTSDVGRSFGNFNMDYTPLTWLTVKYTLGADYSSDSRVEGLPPGNSSQPLGQLDRANYTIFQVDHNLIAQATKQVGSVSTSLTLGQNLNSRSYKQLQVRGTGFITPDLFELTNTISSNLQPLDYESLVHSESYFVEGKADFFNQLYFTAGTRNDASSTYGKSVRHNWFPKASVAWEFSKRLGITTGNGILSYGKLRAAYGQVGREPTPYQVFSGYQVGTFGDGWTNGLNVSQKGNAGLFLSPAKGQEKLKPERNSESEFGTDLAFFDSRIDLGVTYYSGKVTDVILSLPVPPSTGYFSQVANAAELTNKGWEVSANWRALNMRDLTWNVGAQWARNRNLVTDLKGAEQFGVGGFENGVKQGFPFGIILDYDFARCRYAEKENVVSGVDINAVCKAANAPEGALYIDDGVADTKGFPMFDPTQRVVGDPNPNWTGNLSSSLTLWKKVQVSALVDVRNGGQMWNGTKGALYNFGTHKDTEIRGGTFVFGKDYRPQPTVGPGAGTPVVLDQSSWFQNNGSGFVGPAAQFVENAGFTKLRELSVTYTLDQGFVKRSGFNTLDVRLAGRNLWTKTKYTGIDPESNLGGATAWRGEEYFNNPQARSFVVSFNFNR